MNIIVRYASLDYRVVRTQLTNEWNFNEAAHNKAPLGAPIT